MDRSCVAAQVVAALVHYHHCFGWARTKTWDVASLQLKSFKYERKLANELQSPKIEQSKLNEATNPSTDGL
jgi:hypothetical protein